MSWRSSATRTRRWRPSTRGWPRSSREASNPKDKAERLRLAQRAYDKALHATAARLWAEALAADPKLGDDRQAQHRYNAACAAALAGVRPGQG